MTPKIAKNTCTSMYMYNVTKHETSLCFLINGMIDLIQQCNTTGRVTRTKLIKEPGSIEDRHEI